MSTGTTPTSADDDDDMTSIAVSRGVVIVSADVLSRFGAEMLEALNGGPSDVWVALGPGFEEDQEE